VNFEVAVRHLLDGDFSFLEPQFQRGADGQVPVILWHASGQFAHQPEALSEAFTCACFLGADEAIDYLLSAGVHPDGGTRTGMNAVHCAVNRGHIGALEAVIRAGASLEKQNRFGGTALSCAVWSLFNEPRPQHRKIIERLLKAGASPEALPEKTGDAQVDELLDRYRA
jgi:ankyrin repeat protein